MKILYLAFAGTDQRGVHRKLTEQVRGLGELGVQLETLVFADLHGGGAPDTPYRVLDVPGGGFGLQGRLLAFYVAWEAIQKFRPDVVYFRYPVYDAHVLRFVREAPPTVFELQTIYAHEATPEVAAAEAQWAARVLPETAGLVAVTTEILEAERHRAGWAIPGHVMPNGADPSTVPFVAPELDADRIDVLCVASFLPWHGIDRLLVGMALEPDVSELHLHLVGDGPMIPALRQLAAEAGLSDRVHFHGAMSPAALEPWYRRAHLAIGSLAPHRVGLRELAALKHREYALTGLPMIIAGGDADFSATLPWLRIVPADDSPISPRMLRGLALAWRPEARRRQIRSWAVQHLSWEAKLPALVGFLDRCAHDAGRAEGRP